MQNWNRFEGDDFAVGNDFREVGLLVDPTTNGGTGVFTGTTARQTFAVAFSSSSATFEPDEENFTSDNWCSR